VAAVAAPPRQAARLWPRLAHSVWLYRLLVLCAFLIAWQLLSNAHILDPRVFSNPVGVAERLRSLLTGESINGVSIYEQIRVTASEAVVGYVIGCAVAIAVAFVLGRIRLLSMALQPFILAGRGVPIIAVAPIFILALGIGYPSKVATATLATFFVAFFQTFAGVSAISETHIRLARLMGASQLAVARRILVPASLPFIFIGLRMAVPIAVTGAVVGEFIASTSGLGWFVVRAQAGFDAAGLVSGIIIMLAIVWIMGMIVSFAEGRVLRWKPKEERQVG
jgi:NitT/TauT family transport system permease protein